ncbi:hypothetical protein D3C85_858910 [compost metagenome]
MVQRSRVTYVGIHLRLNWRANDQAARIQHTVVQERTAGLGGVAHVETRSASLEEAAITNLTTGFRIERRLIENDHALFAFAQHVDRLPVLIESNDLGGTAVSGVTGEFGVHINLDQAVVVHAEGTGGTGTNALGFHLALETFFVDGQAALASDVAGQVHRETVGIVEFEHHVARHHVALELGQILLEDLQALLQGLGELLFLGLQHALDVRLLLLELGEGFTHLGHQGGDYLVEEAALGAQLVAMTAGATNDAAQHVAAAFVGRQHAVGNQEAAGTDVVGDHLQRRGIVVGAADGLGRSFQQALEQVDLVVRVHVLQHGADALQAHAGVHARRRQRVQHAVCGAIELHEHVVPDLDVAIAIFFL